MSLSSRATSVLRKLLYTATTACSNTSGSAVCLQASRCFGGSTACALPMKPGTVLKSLGVVKDEDPPVVKPREEYPSWVGELATPPPTLAVLRRIPNEEAEDSDIRRYLKLSRRLRVRQRNEQSSI